MALHPEIVLDVGDAPTKMGHHYGVHTMWSTTHTLSAIGLGLTFLTGFAIVLTRFFNLRKESYEAYSRLEQEITRLKAQHDALADQANARLKSLKETDKRHDRQIRQLNNKQIAIITKMKMGDMRMGDTGVFDSPAGEDE